MDRTVAWRRKTLGEARKSVICLCETAAMALMPQPCTGGISLEELKPSDAVGHPPIRARGGGSVTFYQ